MTYAREDIPTQSLSSETIRLVRRVLCQDKLTEEKVIH